MSDTIPAEGPGSTLGHYRLLESLGEGGFGTVFRAEQEEPVRRQVALKLIKLGMDTKEVVARFEAERQALALMDHPAIAKVYDAGATETGRPYFVMELVDGEPVTSFCDRRKLSTSERLELFGDVCLAVQHAHQKGILHRDIKPSNVMVTEVDGIPLPKVIDFGIAKAIERPLTDSSLATEAFQVMGTPEYMPPEQAGGGDVDTRADVYSLGVLLYELLTGTLPFRVGDEGLTDVIEVLRHIREVEPPKPSTRVSSLAGGSGEVATARQTPSGALVRLLRGDLDWIVMRALEKDRERRYATALDLAEDIGRFLRHEPVEASPPSASYRVRKFVRRNRLFVGSSAAVALALIAAVGALIWGFVNVKDERDAAKLARENEREARLEAEGALLETEKARKEEAAARLAESEALKKTEAALAEARKAREEEKEARLLAEESLVEANAVTDFLSNTLAKASPFESHRDVTVVDLLDDAALRLPRIADKPRAYVRLSRTIGTAYRALGSYERARGHLDTALRVARDNFEPTSDPTLLSLLAVSRLALETRDRFEEGEAAALEALELLDARGEGMSDLRIELYDSLGHMYVLLARFEESEEYLLRGIEGCRELYGPDSDGEMRVTVNLQVLYDRMGRAAEGDALTSKLRAYYERRYGSEHPSALRQRLNDAQTMWGQDKRQAAMAEREEVLSIARTKLGDEHPLTLSAMEDLAQSYVNEGRFEDTETLLMESLSVRERRPRDVHMALLEEDLALLLWRTGRTPEAEPVMARAIETLDAELGPDNPDTTEARNVQAIIQYELGNLGGALESWEKLLPVQIAREGEESRNALYTRQNIAMTQSSLGLYAEAEANYDYVMEVGSRIYGPESTLTRKTMNNLAILYMSTGRLEDAEFMNETLLELRSRILGPEAPDTLGTWANLGQVYLMQGRYEDALAVQEEVIPIIRRVEGEKHPSLIHSLASRGSALASLGRFQGASESLRESLEIASTKIGPKTPEAASTGLQLAAVLIELEDREEALEILTQTHAVWAELVGPDHFERLATSEALGTLLVEEGRAEEARPMLRTVLDHARRKALDPKATATDQLAYADSLLNCPILEWREPELALELARKANQRTGHQIAAYLHTLALAASATGDHEGAREAAQKALDRLPESALQREELEALLQPIGDGE